MRNIASASLLAGLALLAGPALAQPCPTGSVVLSVTPDIPIPPGSPITVSVTGTPGAGAILFRGPNAGQTTLPGPGPLGGAVICLNAPFMPIFLGPIPPSGTKTVPMPTPGGAAAGSSLQFQAVTIAPGMPGPTVDTSNTDSVTFGPAPPCTVGTAQLVITPDAPVQAGDTISIGVTAAPGSFVLLVRGPHLGSTPLPFQNLALCLDSPFFIQFFGMVPPGGTLTHQHQVPPGAPLPGNVTVHFQALALSPSGGSITINPSNTDSLTF